MDPAARSRVIRVAAAVIVVGVVGCVLIGVSDVIAVDVAGIALVGIALVVAVAAVFYEVGASEDRERAATERERERATAEREHERAAFERKRHRRRGS